MHVDNHHRSVRRGRGPKGAEVDVPCPDEFAAGIGIGEDGSSVFAIHLCPADKAAHGLGNDEVSLEIGREAVAPVDSLTGTSGEIIESAPFVDAAWSTLNIGNIGDREDFAETVGFLTREVKCSVCDGLLEVEGGFFASCSGIVVTSCVVHSDSPLSAASRHGLDFEFSVGETIALVLVSKVNPVVQVPDQAGRLVLHISPAFATFINFHFFIGDSVLIGVTVSPEVESVGHTDHDTVVQRQDHAREKQIVDEDRVLVINAISIGVLVTRDAGLWSLLAGGVRVLHVGAHFNNVKCAVSIPSHGDRFVDVRVAQHEVESITVLQLNRFVGFLNGKKAFLVNGVTRLSEKGGGEKKGQ